MDSNRGFFDQPRQFEGLPDPTLQTDFPNPFATDPLVPQPDSDLPPLLRQPDSFELAIEQFKRKPASFQTATAPVFFDWDHSRAERYIHSDYYKELGFDPFADNETKYGNRQTFGNVMSNAFAGARNLSWNTFKDGWKGWGRLVDALFSLDANKLVGSPEELEALNRQQEEIFNKYAIYRTPESEHSIFNRQFLGDLIQQSGFTIGTLGQFVTEELLTMGASSLFKPLTGVRALTQMSRAGITTAELYRDLNRAGNFWTASNTMSKLYGGIRDFAAHLPAVGGLVNTGKNLARAIKQGANGWELTGVTLNGLRRTVAETNMALTESRMEAAGTYGELMDNLYQQTLAEKGSVSVTDTQAMESVAHQAALVNFGVNALTIAAMNRIQFDNLFSTFGASKRILREMAEEGNHLFTVQGRAARDILDETGKVVRPKGSQFTKVYEKGTMGVWSSLGKITADFGKKTAFTELSKTIGKNALQLEVTEGIQELVQESSNMAVQDYYTRLYHRQPADAGSSISKGIGEQMSMQGLKVFLMGALTGKLVSPLNLGLQKLAERLSSSGDGKQAKLSRQEALQVVNSFLANPSRFAPEWVANTIVQNRAAQSMDEALHQDSKYHYENAKDMAFVQVVLSAQKLNMTATLLDNIRSLGKYMTDQEFREAYGVDFNDAERPGVQQYMNKIATEIEGFLRRRQVLRDKYGHLIDPLMYEQKDQQRAVLIQRAMEDTLDWVAANEFHAGQSAKRYLEIMAEATRIPSVAHASFQVFRILGDDLAMEAELANLNRELTLERQAPVTEDTKARIRELEQQIKTITTFQQSKDFITNRKLKHRTSGRIEMSRILRMMEAYIHQVGKRADTNSPVAKRELVDLYKLLRDYRDLKQREKEFTDAYNFISSPEGFMAAYGRRLEGLSIIQQNLLSQLQQVIQQTQATPTAAPVPPPVPTSAVTTPPTPGQQGAPTGPTPEGTPPAGSVPPSQPGVPPAPSLSTGAPTPNLVEEVYEFTPEQDYINPAHGIAPLTFRVKVSKDNNGSTKLVQFFALGKTQPTVLTLTDITEIDDIKRYLSALGQLSYFTKLSKGGLKSNSATGTAPDGKQSLKLTIPAIIDPNGVDQLLLDFDDEQLSELTADLDFTPYDQEEQNETYQSALDLIKVHLVQPLQAFQKQLLQQAAENKKKSNPRFKLHGREATRVFVLADKVEVDLSELIRTIPKADLVSKLSLRVTRNPPGTQKELLKNGNNQVLSNPSPLNMELLYDGKIAGYLSHPDALIANINGVPKTLGSLQDDEFHRLFESDLSLAEVRAAYQSGMALVSTIESRLGQQNSITLDNNELITIAFFTTSTGEYDFTQTFQPLQELVNAGNELLAIVDKRIPDQPLLMTTTLAQTQAKVEETMQVLKDHDFKTATAKQGRYIAVVRLPNQQVRFVEVVSAQLTPDQLDTMFVQLRDQVEKTIAENVTRDQKGLGTPADISFNTAFNDNFLTNRFFIAFPPEYRGVYASVEITATGELQLTFFDRRPEKPERHQLYLNNLVDRSGKFRVKGFKELLSQLNLVITNYNTLNKTNFPILQSENFKASIAQNASFQELLGQVTNVSKHVIKNPQIFALASQQAVVPVTGDLSVPQPGTTPSPKSLLSLIDMSKVREGEIYIEDTPTPLPSSPVHALSALKQQEDAEKAALRKRFEDSRGIITDTAGYTTELKKITDKYNKLKAALVAGDKGKRIALKVSEGFDRGAVEDIDTFKAWVTTNLPAFISVDQLDTLITRLTSNKVLMGRFYLKVQSLAGGKRQGVEGVIETSPTNAYKYHEAFHAVFRLLLTDAQIDQLLSVARYESSRELTQKNSTLSQALTAFRSLHPDYASLDNKSLEERYLEEWLADRFDQWKMNHPSPSGSGNLITRFFRTLLDLIRKLFQAKQILPNLFRQIDNSHFKNSQVVDNRFTRQIGEVNALETYKIAYDVDYITNSQGKVVELKKYLSETDTNRLVGGIVNTFIRRTEGLDQYNKRSMLLQILDDYQKLYLGKVYQGLTAEKIDRLEMFRKVFSEDEPRQALIKAADTYISMMGYLQDIDSDEYDAVVDDLGDRRSTDQWQETHDIGGFKSLSQYVRKYMQSIALEGQDEFGNVYLDEKTGDKMLVGINAGIVYNGLMKVSAGVTTAPKFIRRLLIFARENPESRAFVEQFLADTGLVFDPQSNTYTAEKDPRLFNAVYKAFTLFQVDYMTFRIDPGVGMDMKLANRRDAAANQYNRWQNAFIFNYQDALYFKPELKTNLLSTLRSLLIPFQATQPISDEELDTFANQHLQVLQATTGIKISIAYYKYSVAKALQVLKLDLSPEQQELVTNFGEIDPISHEDLLELTRTIAAEENPFINFESLTNDEQPSSAASYDVDDGLTEEAIRGQQEIRSVQGKGNETRLRKIAANNAIFDETVLATSWINSEGKTVWSHQLPTFHLQIVEDYLRDPEKLREMIAQDPFLQGTFLGKEILTQPASSPFLAALKNIRIRRIEGMRQVAATESTDGRLVENRRLEFNKSAGTTYGDFSEREMILALIGLYLEPEHINSQTMDPASGQPQVRKITTTRHLIRVLEASNTGDTINLPVINAITLEGGAVRLSPTARDHFLTELENEYDRIRRVARSIAEDREGIAPITEVIADYNDYDNPNSKMRGLSFWNFGQLLGDLAPVLEQTAQTEYQLSLSDDLKAQAIEKIEERLLGGAEAGMVDDFIEMMADAGIISRSNQKGVYLNELLPPYFFGYRSKVPARLEGLHLRNHFRANVAQFFINDWLNTTVINEWLLGDQARSLKDFIDAVKRAKGANASGYNLRSDILAPQLGIHEKFDRSLVHVHKDQEYLGQYSGQKQKRTDAQLWATVKAQRHIDFALGRLTSQEAAFLDRIELGLPVSSDAIFGPNGSIRHNHQLSVKKIVYYNRDQYIKTSMFVLTKRFTSFLKPDIQAQVDQLLQASGDTITDAIRTLCANNDNWLPLPNMEVLHNKRVMLEKAEKENHRVVFSIPESAAKLLRKNVGRDIVTFSDGGLTELDNSFWRLQAENPSNKLSITDPTQKRHIIDTEQEDSTPVIFRGRASTVGEVKGSYQQDSARRVQLKYQAARDQIFSIQDLKEQLATTIDTGKVTPKLAAFQQRALETLKRTGATSQLLELFEVETDPDTGLSTPKYDLNHPLTLNKYIQLFLAYFRSDVMSEKVPGHALTLFSDFGIQLIKRAIRVDQNGQPVQWEVIPMQRFIKAPQDYPLIKKIGADRIQPGDIFLDELRHNVPEYDEAGNITGYYSEFMMPPHFAAFMEMGMDQIPVAVRKAFGVRIPSQDKHSFISLKWVDMMPAELGSTGIFPKELIEISGADFDVDKLYLQIADFFLRASKEGGYDIVRYGDHAETVKEKFEQYILWNQQHNVHLKDAIRELESLDEEMTAWSNELDTLSAQRLRLNRDFSSGVTLTLAQLQQRQVVNERAELLGKKRAQKRQLLEQRAMAQIGMATTLEQFQQRTQQEGELNIGVLNNRILDAQIQLQTNRYQQENNIPYEVASIRPLEEVEQDPRIAPGVIAEKNIAIDNPMGKVTAFRTNKEGQSNIAPAVRAMMCYTFLNKYKIRFRQQDNVPDRRFSLNGHVFDGYDQNRSATFGSRGKFKGYNGPRILNVISAVISAMTDNAKERKAAKLNLNIDAVGIACNLIAQGVPKEETIAILLSPAIREYYKRVTAQKFAVRTGKRQSAAQILKDLTEEYKKRTGEPEPVVIPLTSKALFKNLRSDDPAVSYATLVNFANILEQSNYFMDVADILKLAKGLGTELEEWDERIKVRATRLGLFEDEVGFRKHPVPFDIRRATWDEHKMTGTYLRIALQLEELSRTMIVPRTELLMTVKKAVLANLNVPPYLQTTYSSGLTNHIILFFGLKAYLQELKSRGDELVPYLDNRLIYDTDASFKDIIDIVQEGRRIAPNNYLLRFLYLNPTTVTQHGKVVDNPSNTRGINTLESNTWAKMDAYQLDKLQNAFIDLYSDEQSRPVALALFAYLIVKDATMFRNDSLVQIIPTFMLEELLGNIMVNVRSIFKKKDLVRLLKNDPEYRANFQAVFGNDFKGLVAEFYSIFLPHVSNNFYIPKVSLKSSQADSADAAHPIRFAISGGQINPEILHLDLFDGVRQKMLIQVASEEGITWKEAIRKNGQLNEKEFERFARNRETLQKKGFRLSKKDGKWQVELPYLIKMKNAQNGYDYFRLDTVSVLSSDFQNRQVPLQDLLNEDFVFKAPQATYRKTHLIGVSAQTALAGLFGEVPATRIRRQRAFGFSANQLTGRTSVVDSGTSLDEKAVLGGFMSLEEYNARIKGLQSATNIPFTSSDDFAGYTPEFFGQPIHPLPSQPVSGLREQLQQLGYTFTTQGGKVQYFFQNKPIHFEGTPAELLDQLTKGKPPGDSTPPKTSKFFGNISMDQIKEGEQYIPDDKDKNNPLNNTCNQ